MIRVRPGIVAPVVSSIAAGVAIAAVVTSGRHGVMTPDSVGYVSAADALRDGQDLVGADGEAFVQWPPLYPALMAALGGAAGISSASAGVIVNVVSHAAMVGVAAHLLRGCRRGVRLVGLGAMTLGPSLLLIDLFVWSEPLFNVVVLGAIAMLVRRDPASSWSSTAAVAAVIGAACLTRYSGAVLVVVAGMATWRWADPSRGTGRAARRAIRVMSVSSLIPLTWFMRNQVVSDSVSGDRFASTLGPADNVGYLVRALGQMAVRWVTTIGQATVAGLFALVLLALLLGRVSRLGRGASMLVVVAGGFALLHAAHLVVLRSVVAFDAIDVRLLSPVVAPVLVLTATTWNEVPFGRWANAAGLAAAATVTVIGAWTFRGELPRPGYESEGWDELEPVARGALASTGSRSCSLMTSEPEGLFVATGVRTPSAPRRHGYYSNERTDDLDELAERIAGGRSVCVLWVSDPSPRPNLVPLDDLTARFPSRVALTSNRLMLVVLGG